MSGVNGFNILDLLNGPGAQPQFPDQRTHQAIHTLNSMDPTSGPTPYPLTQQEKAIIREHAREETLLHPAKTSPTKHWTEVCEMMRRYNDPSQPLNQRQLKALTRLRDLGKLDHWRPDILMKIFLDLDVLLFGGYLEGNVALRWTIEKSLPAIAYCAPPGAQTCGGPSRRTGIFLNLPYIVEEKMCVNEAINTLIHESMHAILSVFCARPYGEGDVATVQRHLPQQEKG